jgi:hypothetical protein
VKSSQLPISLIIPLAIVNKGMQANSAHTVSHESGGNDVTSDVAQPHALHGASKSGLKLAKKSTLHLLMA